MAGLFLFRVMSTTSVLVGANPHSAAGGRKRNTIIIVKITIFNDKQYLYHSKFVANKKLIINIKTNIKIETATEITAAA